MRLACLVSHNVCTELGNMTPRNWDMTVDHETNKRRPQNETRVVLLMNNINQEYLGNYTENGKRIRKEKRRYQICIMTEKHVS